MGPHFEGLWIHWETILMIFDYIGNYHSSALTLENHSNFTEFYALAFTAGAMPCFIDAESQPEGALFPLRVSRIHFVGDRQTRQWRN